MCMIVIHFVRMYQICVCIYAYSLVCMTFIIKLGMFMQIYIFTKIIKENLEKNILLLSALISLFCIFLHIVYIL